MVEQTRENADQITDEFDEIGTAIEEQAAMVSDGNQSVPDLVEE